eukprot:m.1204873 g.1204873  ORF g.1204873 m.1204873 type:complete len:1126 (+) comp24582_c0_seq2:344-3721(+)
MGSGSSKKTVGESTADIANTRSSNNRKSSKRPKQKHGRTSASPTVVKVSSAAESPEIPQIANEEAKQVPQYIEISHRDSVTQAEISRTKPATSDETYSNSVVNQLLLDHCEDGSMQSVEKTSTQSQTANTGSAKSTPRKTPSLNGNTSTNHAIDCAQTASASDATSDPVVGADFKSARPRTAAGHNIKYLSRDQFAERLTAYCEYIFQKADMDEDSLLDFAEFTALVQSRTLGLNISEEGAWEMMMEYDKSHDGMALGFRDFVYVLQDLMKLHSVKLKAKGSEAWEWFVMYFDDDPNSLPLYFNTERRVMTYDKPAGMDYLTAEGDEQKFELLTHRGNGTVYTTTVDSHGQRFYLDMESSDWLPFPDEWLSACVGETASGADRQGNGLENSWGTQDLSGRLGAGEDGQVTRFTHPITGVEYESLMEKGKRLIFDVDEGDWVPIPLTLDAYVPSVVRALATIQEEIPSWSSLQEKILALRQHGYNTKNTIMWKLREEAYDSTKDGTAKAYDVAEVAARLDALEQSADQSRQKTADEVQELDHALQEATSMLARMETESQSIRKMYAANANTVSELTQLLETRERELVELHKRHAAMTSSATISKFKGASEDAAHAAKVNQLELRIAELTQHLQQASGKGGSLEDALGERETALHEARGTIASLTEENAALTAKCSEAEARAGDAEAQVAATAERMQTLSTARRHQSVALTELVSHVELVRNDHSALRDLITQTMVPMTIKMMESTKTKIADKCGSLVDNATKDLITKYRYEVRQRKLLYNELQELKGNIRVFCRVRFDDRVNCALAFPDAHALGTPTEILCPNPRDPSQVKKFTFDRVFNPKDSQQDVFDDTEPVMTSCVDGYNVTIIAYGQTGSGKTYTMMGTEDNPGVNRRCVRELLRVTQERDNVDYTIKVSLLEIYNEKIVDLLSELPVDVQECDLRMDPKTKLGYVTNLTERVVSSIADVVQTLADGEKNRHVASTKMNSTSSRSHLLLQLLIEGHDTISGQMSKGKLTMVDLAGSERIAKTEATGQRLVEAASINKSLSALGQVFTALRQDQSHIPYRNSKLTHILQDSLGGDAKTCVFINTSPAESNLPETLSTLQFGSAISKIELKKDDKPKKKKTPR